TNTQNVTVGGANLPGSFTIFRTSATDNCANVGAYSTGSSLSLPGQCIVTLQAGGTPLATGGGSGLMALSQPLSMTSDEKQTTRVFPNPMNSEVLTVDLSGMRRTGETELQLINTHGDVIRTFTTD